MKLKTIEELKQVAEVRPPHERERMSKQERLERWAEVLELTPQRELRALYETEYADQRRRYTLREDSSPLTVACRDPVLRAEGLQGDKYGDAINFFELSDGDLHYIVCYCHYGLTMTPKAVARRVSAIARSTERKSLLKKWLASLLRPL